MFYGWDAVQFEEDESLNCVPLTQTVVFSHLMRLVHLIASKASLCTLQDRSSSPCTHLNTWFLVFCHVVVITENTRLARRNTQSLSRKHVGHILSHNQKRNNKLHLAWRKLMIQKLPFFCLVTFIIISKKHPPPHSSLP